MKILVTESQYNILTEGKKKEEFFIPRRSREERKKMWRAAIYKQIQRYIKNGSTGNLDLSNTPVLLLPDNLTYVGGFLDLSYTPITKLPDNLTVGGYLDLDYSNITEAPKNLTVRGNVYLSNTPLSRKYGREEIRDMITKSGGSLEQSIFV